ncbi:MAG: histidine ammonia-lyase [Clostridiales bacterium]|jgi:histidine ammonia-lyase|nr:histidine ammonia-lyase [Clostridiales bacterium]
MGVVIGLKDLTCKDVVAVARFNEKVLLDQSAEDRILASRAVVDKYVKESKIAYGITTGVGKLCNTIVSPEQAAQLQTNLSMSHSCGIGEPLSEEEARAIMLIRANILSLGYSGVSLPVVKTLISMLNAGINPVLPKNGGVGSSGSLSIGAHLALAMTGKGEVFLKGERMLSDRAFMLCGLEPVTLQTKDCLCLINGTHSMCGIGILALQDLYTAVKTAEIAAALSLEAMTGNVAAFDIRINEAKKHQGQRNVALNVLRMIENSELYNLKPRSVQDAYSLRCLPQIHGGARETMMFSQSILEREINSVSDNPLILVDDETILSCGNFHGQIPAIALDNIAIACATIAKISERRISRLVDPQSSGLPAFLVKNSGLNSGYMIPQYISASLTSEIKLLANPASVDSIPTSGGQEDIVSNGTIAANKAREAVDNLQIIIGIELMCAAQALELSGRKNLGAGTAAAYKLIRQYIESLDNDRIIEPDINTAAKLVSSGELVDATEKVIGALD